MLSSIQWMRPLAAQHGPQVRPSSCAAIDGRSCRTFARGTQFQYVPVARGEFNPTFGSVILDVNQLIRPETELAVKPLWRIIRSFLGATLSLSIATSVAADEHTLFPISIEGKWGYINNAGKVVIEPQFLKSHYFSEGLAVVEITGTTEEDRVFKRTYQGFIGTDGKFVIPPQPPSGVRDIERYDTYSFGDFHEGLARIHINDASGMDGYIDRTGKLVIQPKYGSAGDFSDGVAYAETWRRWDRPGPKRRGFIDKQGSFVIEDESFTYSCGFAEGVAYVSVDSDDDTRSCGLIDRSGKYVIQPGMYNALSNPVGGAIRAVKNEKVGLLNRAGEIIVAFGAYDQILEPTDGAIFVAELNGDTVLIDANGKRLAGVREPGDVGRFANGMATIKHDGRYGYIDATGSLKIPVQYDAANPFKHGLALITSAGTRGYVTDAGEYVWKTDRWDEPLRNSVSKPLSTFLPESTIEALPLSYNWQGVENAIVFVANGNLKEMQAWYRKRCSAKTKLRDHTDFKFEPAKINLSISRPGESFLEVFAVDGNSEAADGFVAFYSCDNMDRLRKKHPNKIVGIVIEN